MLVCFIVGSKMDADVGIGVTKSRFKFFKSKYQDEMHVIETCA